MIYTWFGNGFNYYSGKLPFPNKYNIISQKRILRVSNVNDEKIVETSVFSKERPERFDSITDGIAWLEEGEE